MPGRDLIAARGVLRTSADGSWQLLRWEPSPALAPYVAWHWGVAWDRRGLAAHEQVTLPHPSAHLTVEAETAWLYGPSREHFKRTLAGTGRVVGTRFRPGGVRPLLDGPVAAIAGRRLQATALGGLDAEDLARAVESQADFDAAVNTLEAVLAAVVPRQADPAIAVADEAVRLLAEDRSLTRVSDLADRLAMAPRSLHRLFSEYVGLGPARVIRRYRLQEVAAHALAGEPVDWARLAAELGYYDQAHLIREFTATTGSPPARYAGRSPGLPASPRDSSS